MKTRYPKKPKRLLRDIVPEHLRVDITLHFGFAVYWINRAHRTAIAMFGLEDVYCAALRGLFHTSRGYTEKKGKFTTYARHYIDSEVWKLFLANRRFYRPEAKRRYEERRKYTVVPFSVLGHSYVTGSANVFAYTPEPIRDVPVKALRGWMSDLKKREVSILELRYGLNDNNSYTLDEVAKILGVTRERIRQIEENALRKIREASNGYTYES